MIDLPDWLRPRPPLTQERLKELLHYDPETGVFTYRVSRGKGVAGREAGNRRSDGYRVIILDRKHYLAHRLAWLYAHGRWPTFHIDHADRDPSNNRLANLREVTRSQNQHNRGRCGRNTSGAKGVYWDKKNQRWLVSVCVDGRQNHVGRFDDFGDAEEAAKRARTELHKEFATNE